jgi:DNA repair protein RecO (recombination protein O)
MLTKTKGIVLQRTKYADTGLIVKIFTKEHGNVSFFVKNSFSKKSKFSNALFAPLSLLELNFDYRKKSSLQYFKEVTTYYQYSSIPFNLSKNLIFIFYTELISKLLYETSEDEELFTCIEKQLIELDTTEVIRPDIHLIFMYELSRKLGFEPINNYDKDNCYFSIVNAQFARDFINNEDLLSKEASYYLQQIIIFYQNQENITFPSKNVRNELLQGLIKYYLIHNEHIKSIDSVAILSNIFK